MGGRRALRRSFPRIDVHQAAYKDAGAHLLSLWGGTERFLEELVMDSRMQKAAGARVLRVMRKRATAFARYHCRSSRIWLSVSLESGLRARRTGGLRQAMEHVAEEASCRRM